MHLLIVPLNFFLLAFSVKSETLLGTGKKSCTPSFVLLQLRCFRICVDACLCRLPHRCPSRMLVTAWSNDGPDVALVGAAEGPCRR